MSDTIIEPRRGALIAIIFCLPFVALALITGIGIEPLLGAFKSYATVDGQQVNGLGRVIVFGGFVLLPIAFCVNLSSMFARPTRDKIISFRPQAVNLTLGSILLSGVVFVASWMIAESLNCSRGICD